MNIRSSALGLAAAAVLVAGCSTGTTAVGVSQTPTASPKLTIPDGVTPAKAANAYFCLGAGAGDLPEFDVSGEPTQANAVKLAAWLDQAASAMDSLDRFIDGLVADAEPKLAPEFDQYIDIAANTKAAMVAWRAKVTAALADNEFTQAEKDGMIADANEATVQMRRLGDACEGLTKEDMGQAP